MASLLGKEAGLYMPSGTMSNLTAVLVHCWGRGSEIVVGDGSHIYRWEQGGVAQLGGVHTRTVKNREDGTFSIKDLRTAIQYDDQHLAVTSLVAIENSHNGLGGRAVPLHWIRDVATVCRENKIPLHCDGARWGRAQQQQQQQ